MLERYKQTRAALKVVLPGGAPGVVWAMMTLTLATLIGLIAPYLVKLTIDRVILNNEHALLWWIGLGGLGLYGVRALCQWSHRWWLTRLEEGLHRDLRQRLFAKTLTLDLGHHRRLTPGYLLSRVEADTAEVSALLTQVLPGLWQVGFQVAGTGILLLWLAPTLTLMALLPMPLFLVLAYIFDRRIRPKTRARLAKRSALYGTLSEVFDGIEAVLVYHGEAEVGDWLDMRAAGVERVGLSLGRDRATIFPVLDFSISCVLLGVLIFGGQQVVAGTFTIGAMAAYYFYLARTLAPVRMMPGIVFGWHRAQTALMRTKVMFETVSAIQSPAVPVVLADKHVPFRFEDVHFAYGQGDQKHIALAGVSFDMNAGARVAILGPSGAGKSTLGRMVPRLIDPDQGGLYWGDVSLQSMALEDARAMVGYVGQEVFLFEGTLAQNVCFGVEDVSEEALARVLWLACVDELLEQRHEDASMEVGPRGGQLSGGQKKRVALARALLHEPQILVIDQLASDLESALNGKIFDRLKQLESMRILYLGHRLPQGFDSDKVYRLEHGLLECVDEV